MGDELGVNLWVKRDDTASLALGGNKVRQLGYYLGAAAHNTDTVLITGAIQSNFVRLCVAAARKLGWHPVVQLEHRVSNQSALYQSSGNVLLNRLMGADIRYFDGGDDEAAADHALDQLAAEQRALGRTPHVVHLGMDHPPIGALGYVECALEADSQLNVLEMKPDHVVIPSGSGLTHAGFLIGASAWDSSVKVHGVCVRRDKAKQQTRIFTRATEAARLMGLDPLSIELDVRLDDAVLPPGYGQLNESVLRAIRMAAETEGLLLDPVYSGRTMAGLMSLVERGVIKKGESVLFIHTGGIPAVFAYQNELVS